jgi:signal transduction histidine kinase
MRPRRATFILIAFFAGLAALELAHGASRLSAVRGRRVAELSAVARAAHRDLATAMRAAFDAERRHASYLARSPSTRRLVETPADPDARRAAEAQLLAYLAAFDGFDAVRVLDRRGAELARVRRVGAAVGALPPPLLAAAPEPAVAAALAAAAGAETALAGFAYDAARVEVPVVDRQVAHHVARIGDGAAAGALVLTVYVSPTLNRVRRFAPVPGAYALLVDEGGRYLAAPDRERERGGAREGAFSRDYPAAAGALANPGDGPVRAGDADVHVAAVSVAPPLRLATFLPDAPLAAAADEGVRGEYARIVAGTVAVSAVLATALFFFLRLAARAAKQRETELELRELERRRALESRLANAERLSSLGLLTAGVAHEINNPLEGIGNYLALLDRGGDDPDKRRRYLEAVRHGFDRIRNLVRDLLNFGRPGVAAGACDARSAVLRAVDLARLGKDGRGVDFSTRGFDAPVRVACDAGRLEQVFLNLLLNAAKAIRGRAADGGSVVVGAARVADEGGRTFYEFRVDDDGPGVPPEHLPKLFDPFFTTGGGSGLGLAVCHGILRAHGGDVSAENLPGGGARFTVRLPAADGEREP